MKQLKKLTYIDKAMIVIVSVTLIIAAVAIMVGLDLLAIGEGGIQFKF